MNDDKPHGQHIEREALHQATGLTTKQRDTMIQKLHDKGWSQRQIATQLKMTQAGVSFALKRMRGEDRNRVNYDVCDACGDTTDKTSMVDGLCPDCAKDLRDMGL